MAKRKNKTFSDGGLKIFSIAWPPKMYTKIDVLSRKENISKGELVKRIVGDALNDKGKNKS